MFNELIIEIPYGGLGDHLFHSHLPRIAKETGKYKKVYISNKSLFRHPDNKKLVWECNPYIDGFTDLSGIACDLKTINNLHFNYNDKKINLLDVIMIHYEMEDYQRWHEPEIYYKPLYREEYNKVIFDPNYLSWVGEITKKEMMSFIKKRGFVFEAIMKIRTEKALFIPTPNDVFIETNSLFDFCDLIYSAKKLYCLTSGTATIAAGLNKKATVFYGNNQSLFYQHSKLHDYIKVNRTIKSIIMHYFYKMKSKYFKN